jgi:HPt (histidine-containing phosphotransfer) domain-containing protein
MSHTWETANRDGNGSTGSEGAERSAEAADVSWSPQPLVDRLGGDEELARQLVSLFLTEYPQMVSTVRESVASGSADRIRRAAHALKGSVSNFTDGAPTTTAFELEQIGRESRLSDAPAVLDRLQRDIDAFAAQLRAYEQGPPCTS